MIYRDKHGYPISVDDGMDSCVRQSILALRDIHDFTFLRFYERRGRVHRHPTAVPADNALNCTPDQIKMWLMSSEGNIPAVRRVFWMHVLRLGFSQDLQRDYRGSWKFPWKHYTQDWNFKTHEKKGEPELRYFDFATPTLPAQWGMMIIKGKLYAFYPLLIISYLHHFINLIVNRYQKSEVNQLFAECRVLGTIPLMLWIVANFKDRLFQYWCDRNEVQYAEIIVADIQKKNPTLLQG